MFKVLVVEDESLVRRALVSLTPWQDLGFEFCAEAENGSAALSLFMQHQPQVIITDIRMPVMDGLDFIQKVFDYVQKEACPEPEVIILTGYSEFEYARKALMLGVHEYVLKPVEEEILYDSLERAKQRLLDRQKEKERVQISLFEKIQSADSDDTGIAFNYVKESIALIENHYVLGITIEEAAQKLGISSGHLSRLFKQSTKLTFNEYVRNVRIEKAIALLKDQSIKIYEIADLVGYLDVKYFTQTFKKITGLTPSEYRYRFFQASQAIDTE